MDKEKMFCTTHARRDTQHPTWKIKQKLFSGDQVVGRKKPAHRQIIDQIFWGVVFNVSSHLFGVCCGSECIQA